MSLDWMCSWIVAPLPSVGKALGLIIAHKNSLSLMTMHCMLVFQTLAQKGLQDK